MASPQPVSFGQLLKRYRIAAGLTQEELAQQAGLSARAIGALETGARRAPRKDTVELLAQALGLSAAEHVLFAAAARQRLSPSASQQRIPPGTLDTPGQPTQAQSLARRGIVLVGLVGRAAELSALERHLAGDGTPLFLLAGEPGIGKSRLLAELSTRALAQGWTVLAGGCHRRSGQEPFAPLVGALTRFLASRSPAQQRLDLQGCAWLVRLLPELAEHALVPAPSWALPAEQERRLLFAAVTRFLANVAGPAGTLLVLDDLQWAGDDALDLLAALVRETQSGPLRIVGAYRDTDVGPRDTLSLLLGDLARDGLAARMMLSPLARDEGQMLLTALLADVPDAFGGRQALLDTVLDRAGGLPLFLESCAQEVRTGTLAAGTPANLIVVPWSAAESIRQRLAVLPETTQDVVAVAAVVGRHAPRPLLFSATHASGQDEAHTLAGVEAACHARLLVEATDGSYTFTHDLIRETLVADLGGARRAALHRWVAEALEQQPVALMHAAELAWHFAEADMPEHALPYALQAGDHAEAAYAHTDADQLYRQAAELAHQVGDPIREAEALAKRGDVQYRLAHFSDAFALHQRAVAIYREAKEWDRLAWATCQMIRAGDPLGYVESSIAWLDELLTTLAAVADGSADGGALLVAVTPSDHMTAATREACAERAATILTAKTAARVYLCFTSRMTFTGRGAEACAASEKTINQARAAHDQRIESLAYSFRSQALRDQGQLDEAQAAAAAAHSKALASGELEALYMALVAQIDIDELQGNYRHCRDMMEQTLQIVEQLGDVHRISWTLFKLAHYAFVFGDWNEARSRYAAAAEIVAGRREESSWLELLAAAAARLDFLQGRQAADGPSAEGVLVEAGRSSRTMLQGFSAWVLAERDLVADRPAAARERLLSAGCETIPDMPEATDLRALLAWAELELGDITGASAALDRAISLAGAMHNRIARVNIVRVAALIAARHNRWEDAQVALEEAIALSRAIGYPYAEAKALYVYGQLHKAKGEPELAREKYEAALAICARLGERLYAEQIERALHDLSA